MTGDQPHHPVAGSEGTVPAGALAVVVTVSDRSAAGERADTSGPLAAHLLQALGFSLGEVVVVPDEAAPLIDALRTAARADADLVVTTGGTGVSPRDITPEATLSVVDRLLPGIPESMRQHHRDVVPTTILSRGVCGVTGRTLIVNLPGSPGGVRDGIEVLAPVVGHLVVQLRGGDH